MRHVTVHNHQDEEAEPGRLNGDRGPNHAVSPIERPQQTAPPNMIWIQGGMFRMGSDRHYLEEAPVHRVTVWRTNPMGDYIIATCGYEFREGQGTGQA